MLNYICVPIQQVPGLSILRVRKRWTSMACLHMDFPDSIEILHHFTHLTHFYARQTNSTIFFTYVTIQHTQQPQASECHHCLGEHLCYCGCCVQIIVSFQFRNLFYWNHNEILLFHFAGSSELRAGPGKKSFDFVSR